MNNILVDFARLAQNNFQNAIRVLLGVDVVLNIKDADIINISRILPDFEGDICFNVYDASTSIKGGFIFKTADITAIANMMISGDYKEENVLKEDLLDASNEFLRQLIGSINVPIFERYKHKVSFEIEELTTLDEAYINSFKDNCCVFSFELSWGKHTVIFVLFFESKFKDIIIGDSIPQDKDTESAEEESIRNVDLLMDIEVPIGVKVGSTKIFLKDLLSLAPGNIIELEQSVNDPVELTVNNRTIATGEVVLADGYFGLKIKEILNRSERIKKLSD